MGTFYRANQELKDYLISNGFVFHDRSDADTQYFTHSESGNQVKLEHRRKYVTLLDREGYIVDKSNNFTDNQIQSFINYQK
jgi:hypothetical protein